MAKIKITLVRSLIGRPEAQRRVVRSLGLRKTNSFVIKEDTPTIMGMVNKVSHLLKVEQV
ncbi:MAG: 50S ribosomal protein L30 [Desulfurispora sp.]|uniref:50S ribosomal protein L30 n=1 Tax=Desulfurispora TaxID=510701 RepID=UPI000360DF07|nr:50S ribosomal protein L30 [Desulfurispora thermophila]